MVRKEEGNYCKERNVCKKEINECESMIEIYPLDIYWEEAQPENIVTGKIKGKKSKKDPRQKVMKFDTIGWYKIIIVAEVTNLGLI